MDPMGNRRFKSFNTLEGIMQALIKECPIVAYNHHLAKIEMLNVSEEFKEYARRQIEQKFIIEQAKYMVRKKERLKRLEESKKKGFGFDDLDVD